MRALKVRSRSRGSGNFLKKVVYSMRKIEILRKNLSPRVDLPAPLATALPWMFLQLYVQASLDIYG